MTNARVANFLAEHEKRLAIARVLDECTVALLALTSSPEAAIRAAYEDRAGLPAYDEAPQTHPRDEVRVCLAPGCLRRFWARIGVGGSWRHAYCSDACRVRAFEHRKRALATNEERRSA